MEMDTTDLIARARAGDQGAADASRSPPHGGPESLRRRGNYGLVARGLRAAYSAQGDGYQRQAELACEVSGWRCRKSRIAASALTRSASSITSICDRVAMAATSESALRSCPLPNSRSSTGANQRPPARARPARDRIPGLPASATRLPRPCSSRRPRRPSRPGYHPRSTARRARRQASALWPSPAAPGPGRTSASPGRTAPRRRSGPQRECLGAAFHDSHSGQRRRSSASIAWSWLYRDDIGTEAGERAGQDAGPRAQIHHPHRLCAADRCQAPADCRFGVARAVLRVLSGSRAE